MAAWQPKESERFGCGFKRRNTTTNKARKRALCREGEEALWITGCAVCGWCAGGVGAHREWQRAASASCNGAMTQRAGPGYPTAAFASACSRNESTRRGCPLLLLTTNSAATTATTAAAVAAAPPPPLLPPSGKAAAAPAAARCRCRCRCRRGGRSNGYSPTSPAAPLGDCHRHHGRRRRRRRRRRLRRWGEAPRRRRLRALGSASCSAASGPKGRSRSSADRVADQHSAPSLAPRTPLFRPRPVSFPPSSHASHAQASSAPLRPLRCAARVLDESLQKKLIAVVPVCPGSSS